MTFRHCDILFGISFVIGCAGVVHAEDPNTLPNSCCEGPRIPSWDGTFMKHPSHGNAACDVFIEAGWGLVEPSDHTTPRRLEGEVVAGHLPHGDNYFNHKTEDANFFVVPDNHNPMANFPNEDYRFLLGKGNFETGAQKEWGRVEVEWEYGALQENDAADNGYYGFPPWAWPNMGDRVLVEGFWIFDCGHEECDGCYRSEIHPPRLVVTYRNTMQSEIARQSNRPGWVDPLGPDDRDFSRVARVDVFASSWGGAAVDDIFEDSDFFGRNFNGPDWWQPVNDKDYDFDIVAPTAKPFLGAQLIVKVLDPPSDYIPPPGATHPPFDPSNPAHISPPFLHSSGREAVHIHIPFTQTTEADYMTFAKSFIVGYDVSEPEVKHFQIHVSRWHVYDDLEGISESEYSAWVHTRNRGIFIPISDGAPDEGEPAEYNCTSDGNYMPWCFPDNNETNHANTTFDIFIGPEDPLILSFHAKESDVELGSPFIENDDAGFAEQAFTAAENYGVGSHHLTQADRLFCGVYHDFFTGPPDDDDPCDGPNEECYEIAYTITRLMDPTQVTIGVPTVQYAMDPNHFTATVVTPGPPDKPRRHLPVTIDLVGGSSQGLLGITNDDGLADPTDLLTLPAGNYTNTSAFAGNGLLDPSSTSESVVIAKDFTASSLTVDDEVRWGHEDPFTVNLMEPNVGQDEPPLPVVGKMMTVHLTGLLGSISYPAGPTDLFGNATITPFMTLPPGNYEATTCFTEDPWFLGSCSAPQPVKVTVGFSAFARGGPISISGGGHTSLGDMHSETSIDLSGNAHVLSAGTDERMEYVTTLLDGSTGSTYNDFQITAFGISPQFLASTYCGGNAMDLLGVPITRRDSNWTIKNDTVLSGIYCVAGNIKMQARLTGSAVLVATGTITTSGGNSSLTTADPTGADVLMLAQSTAVKAISLAGEDCTYTGNLVATGGIELSSSETLVDGAMVGQVIVVKGSTNTLDGR